VHCPCIKKEEKITELRYTEPAEAWLIEITGTNSLAYYKTGEKLEGPR
jgi:hypothetical protein